jgi:hypothetical protein
LVGDKLNTHELRLKQREERLGETNVNKLGFVMTIVEYNSHGDITVEFNDEFKTRQHSSYKNFKNGTIHNTSFPNVYLNNSLKNSLKADRLGEKRLNYQGCEMEIIDYIDSTHITVRFNDEYKAVLTPVRYSNYVRGVVKNPYFPEVYGVGCIGVKYPSRINKIKLKEYNAWCKMLQRGFSKKVKDKYTTYKDVTVCKEWLNYENFYEWLHSQENFDKWLNGSRWNIDKDIISKDNKIYSPDTCCLVPQEVNVLFVRQGSTRGEFPIGVCWNKSHGTYSATCSYNGSQVTIGFYQTPEEAFQAYKEYKESIIKETAKEYYSKGEIIKRCYDAMMNYEVEITD